VVGVNTGVELFSDAVTGEMAVEDVLTDG